MQRAFGIGSFGVESRIPVAQFEASFAVSFDSAIPPLGIATRLIRCLRFVKTRLPTIGRIAMNDSTLGRFVDRRNRRTNLIRRPLWR